MSADWLATPASGVPKVITGDRFEIGDEQVQLWGILAPESCAPGFEESKQHLTDLIGGAVVTCDRYTTLSQDITAGRCHTAEIADLSKRVVSDGYAVNWPKYSDNDYRDTEIEAVKARHGLWRSIEPWDAEQKHKACL